MIPPHGPKDAKIVFVIDWGEKDDAKYNLPLVGAPGDEMSRILAKAGIRRNLLKTYTVNQGWTTKIDSEVYVTLLHKEYVDKEFEFIHHYFDDAKATVPKPEFIQLQKDLYQELAVLNPNVIVACGEYSLRVLTGHRGIGNWRGSIVKSELLPGKKVVCMHRPSNIISSWDLRPLQILDCKKVKEQSEFPEIKRIEREFIINPTLDQVYSYRKRLMEAEYVSWDIETKYNHTSCIGFSDDIKFALCVPLIARGTHYWSTPEEERAIWEFFRDVLSAKSKKIGQNLLFDCSHMRAHGIRVANIYHDCMLAQNVLYPELEKSLGVLVSIYTNEQYHKGEGKKALKKLGSDKAWAGSTVDDDLFLYNCKDAAYTLEVSFAQMEEFKKLHSFQRKIV